MNMQCIFFIFVLLLCNNCTLFGASITKVEEINQFFDDMIKRGEQAINSNTIERFKNAQGDFKKINLDQDSKGPNAFTITPNTPAITYAIRCGKYGLAEYLATEGFNPKLRDGDGKLPQDYLKDPIKELNSSINCNYSNKKFEILKNDKQFAETDAKHWHRKDLEEAKQNKQKQEDMLFMRKELEIKKAREEKESKARDKRFKDNKNNEIEKYQLDELEKELQKKTKEATEKEGRQLEVVEKEYKDELEKSEKKLTEKLEEASKKINEFEQKKEIELKKRRELKGAWEAIGKKIGRYPIALDLELGETVDKGMLEFACKSGVYKCPLTGNNLLHEAVLGGNEENVKRIIEISPDLIEQTNNKKQKPIDLTKSLTIQDLFNNKQPQAPDDNGNNNPNNPDNSGKNQHQVQAASSPYIITAAGAGIAFLVGSCAYWYYKIHQKSVAKEETEHLR